MTDPQNYGFAKLVPGFDFLQNLAKGATESLPQMPSLSNWVAPTLDVKELDKRIQELRAVHFWLEQNSKALGATIQALEVQKMTLATLEGMNCSMTDLAQAMKMPSQAEPQTETKPASGKASKTAKHSAAAPGMVDPLQWWGSLTQQFQHIAASAMQEAGQAAQSTRAPAGAASRRPATGKAADDTAGKAKPASAAAKSRRKPRRPASPE